MLIIALLIKYLNQIKEIAKSKTKKVKVSKKIESLNFFMFQLLTYFAHFIPIINVEKMFKI